MKEAAQAVRAGAVLAATTEAAQAATAGAVLEAATAEAAEAPAEDTAEEAAAVQVHQVHQEDRQTIKTTTI